MSTNWTVHNTADHIVALETHPTREAATAALSAYIDRTSARVVSRSGTSVYLKFRDGSAARVVFTDL